jgi:hypothetical protein
MKYKLTFCLLLISVFSFSQNNSIGKRDIKLIVGKCFNGTGDLRGLIFTTEYAKAFKKRLSWIVGIGGTIHDGYFPVFFTIPNGDTVDGSVRYTIAGVQIIGQIGYSAIKTTAHEVQMRAGALIRYQSSSYYDIITVLYPGGTGLPFPVVIFDNKTPQRTYSIGGNFEIHYNYSLTKKIMIGILAGLQTDTNGDTITQLSLSIGRRF